MGSPLLDNETIQLSHNWEKQTKVGGGSIFVG